MAFLDCHSKIRFRALEPGVFPLKQGVKGDAEKIYSDHWPFKYGTLAGKIDGNIGGYLIPEVTDDEFLIEKSPAYSEQYKGTTIALNVAEIVAKEMKNLMPNVKLFMFVSDPVDRMFSHIKDSLTIKYIIGSRVRLTVSLTRMSYLMLNAG